MVPGVPQAVSVYVIPPIMGSVVLLGLVLISVLRGGRKRTNLLFAAICFLGVLLNADVAAVSIISDEKLALRLDRTVHFFLVFSIPIYIRFVHEFLGIRNRRWLEIPAWLFSISFLPIVPTEFYFTGFHHYAFGRIARAGILFHLLSVAFGGTAIYCLAVLYRAMKETADNQRKNRIKYIFGGMGFSVLLFALSILPVSGIPFYPPGNFTFIPAIFLAFGVLKYDLLDIGVLIRRGTVYFLLTGILTGLYIVVIFLFHTFIFAGGRGDSIVLSLVLALIIVLFFTPLRERLQGFIDRLFFRGRYDYHESLKEISGRLALLLSLPRIRELLIEAITRTLEVESVKLILTEEGVVRIYGFQEAGATGQEPLAKERMGSFIRALETAKRPLSRSAVEKRRSDDRERENLTAVFEDLGAVLVVPLPAREGLAGLIALGQKRSGELFVDEDMELLTTIANQAATAIENARSYEALAALNRDLEQKVEERTAALREALAEKERTQNHLIRSESLAAIGQLVAGTAHELNNPIAGAMSLVETSIETLAGSEVAEQKRAEVLDDLRFSLGELRRAASIIRSLLDLSRQTQTYVEAVDMNRVADDALRVLHNRYKDWPVEIVREYDSALPAIQGNFANLGQVMINIVLNALQALPEGRGKITLITRRQPGRTVVVECRDTGVGIPEAFLKDIFKPFFTTKTVGRGTGLGLYLSHEIVRRHNGEIRVLSEEGRGTVVTVELPCGGREG
jgi:two-component system NtrC family sensor kinase